MSQPTKTDGANGKKRKYNHYGHQGHSKKQHCIDKFQDGMKGLLVTCNFREIEAVRETYNLVQQYIDNKDNKDEKHSNPDEEDDVDKAIEREVSQLTSKPEKKFGQVDTLCKNIVFVNILRDSIDPLDLVTSLFHGIETSGGQLRSRFINRITPVAKTCKASVETVTKVVEELLGPKDDCEGSFKVFVKIRNNNSFHQTDFIEGIAKTVKELRPKWTVDFDNPKTTICIDVLIKVACVSLLPNYFALKKYNILEYASSIKKKSLQPKESEEKKLIEEEVVPNTAIEETNSDRQVE